MKYRHFPRIENRDFSILALSLAGIRDRARAEALLRAADGAGINMVCAGADPEAIATTAAALESTGARSRFSLLVSIDAAAALTGGTSPERAMADLLASAGYEGPGSRDFLSIDLSASPERAAETLRGGWAREAERLRSAGRIAGCGFRTEADGAAIIEAIDAWPSCDFFACDSNYPLLADEKRGLRGAIRYAAANGIGFIATDPFAGGTLENVPPAIHELFRNARIPRAHDEWALRAVWEMQETVFVGWQPGSPEELARKAIFAEAGRPNSLLSAELDTLKKAGEKLLQ